MCDFRKGCGGVRFYEEQSKCVILVRDCRKGGECVRF